MSAAPSPPQEEPARLDRRARRRQETIEEILEISVVVMTEEGVNGLSLSEVARRLGVQPPSLYKYFPSLHAVFDAIFERGQRENLEVMRAAMADAEPGLDALTKGLEASGSWALANQAVAQLLFWRPVPSFEPSTEALAPSHEMVAMQHRAMVDAVDAGQLGEGARELESVYLVSTFVMGVLSQAMANEPELPWGKGRFTPLFSKLMGLLVAAYPPEPRRASRTKRASGTKATR
jgi:AcrR family transcriptional regulator